jgi:5-methylcytosine-specific restriction endonuclease McrA
MEQYKTCSKCKQSKSLDDFYKCKDKYQSPCKDCQKAYRAVEYAKNPEKMRKKAAAYRANNPEKVKAARQAHKRNNPEMNRACALRYQQKYPEKHVKATTAYRQRNKDKYRNYSQNRRVKKLQNGIYEISIRELKRILAKPCINCQSKENITLDHIIPVSLGGTHSVGNIQPLCMPCNSSKGGRVMTVWRKFLRNASL